jgi:hypothetical protein
MASIKKKIGSMEDDFYYSPHEELLLTSDHGRYDRVIWTLASLEECSEMSED